MKFGTFIICVLLIVTSANAEIPNTLDVVTAFSETAVKDLIARIPQKGPMAITIAEHPDAKWIEALVMREAYQAGYTVVTNAESVALTVVIRDLSTRYTLVPETDSIQREIVVAIEGIVTMGGERQLLTPAVQRSVQTCTRTDAKAAESLQRSATHGEFPPESSSTWDDIVEPVIFIAAAVATVVLLFTVRSK